MVEVSFFSTSLWYLSNRCMSMMCQTWGVRRWGRRRNRDDGEKENYFFWEINWVMTHLSQSQRVCKCMYAVYMAAALRKIKFGFNFILLFFRPSNEPDKFARLRKVPEAAWRKLCWSDTTGADSPRTAPPVFGFPPHGNRGQTVWLSACRRWWRGALWLQPAARPTSEFVGSADGRYIGKKYSDVILWLCTNVIMSPERNILHCNEDSHRVRHRWSN